MHKRRQLSNHMVSLTKVLPRNRESSRWPLVLRFALRDFRGGLRGFGIFLGAIALGVAAITGVGSVSLSLKDGLAQQGRTILGADASFDLAQRELSAPERDYLGRAGAFLGGGTVARDGAARRWRGGTGRNQGGR